MAGPSLSILVPTNRGINEYSVESVLHHIGAANIGDSGFYWGGRDPSPFCIGFQAEDYDPVASAVLRKRMGHVPEKALVVGSMCNSTVDHFRLAIVASKIAEALGGIVLLELYSALPSAVGDVGWSCLIQESSCFEPTTYKLFHYAVEPCVLATWVKHPEFHLVK